MPQALLPMIPAGATPINDLISVAREGGQWTYFCGIQPIFQHAEDDRRSFRLFTAQLYCRGACTQADIVRCFGVTKNSVLRSVAQYRQEGNDGFYRSRRVRGASVLTAEVVVRAERLLDQGRTRREVAEELGIQYDTPGELGKLMGLDRIPEVRCLRNKMAALSENEAPERWASVLSQEWMKQNLELAGTLYADGHVRLYHGRQTTLPRRYVARQRLCLRGTTDYWINDALGQPFFSVERPIDHGLLEVLRNEVVPRLLKEVPGQPTPEQLQADPYRSRFVIVFDREGYSPAFFREMWQQHRIACITYHKYPKEAWAESEFAETQVPLPAGEVLSLKLAERGSWIGDRRQGLWVREVRKLNPDGHQTSLVSTAYGQLGLEDAGRLFSRWSQENFFRYMMEHYAIDALNEYRTEVIPGTTRPVVNPAWRKLDGQSRTLKGRLTQRQARFAALTLHPQAEPSEIEKWERQKADLREQIEQLEHEWTGLKERMKSTPRHLAWDDLPEEQKFQRLAPSRKRLADTVKWVAYRAETALTMIVREKLAHPDEARALVRDLFRSDADLHPDEAAGVLTVRLHTLANPRSNRAIQHLLDQLNAAESTCPDTNLRLTYTLAATPPNASMVPS